MICNRTFSFYRGSRKNHNKLQVAVIGGAAAGITMLHYFACHATRYTGVRFFIFDKFAGQWGGPAHSTNSNALRINMRPELHDVEGFIPFSTACKLQGWDTGDLPLRWLLGKYLGMVFDCARSKLELNGATVDLVKAEVIALHRIAHDYVIWTDDGQSSRFNFIILATGNNPPSVPQGLFREARHVA